MMLRSPRLTDGPPTREDRCMVVTKHHRPSTRAPTGAARRFARAIRVPFVIACVSSIGGARCAERYRVPAHIRGRPGPPPDRDVRNLLAADRVHDVGDLSLGDDVVLRGSRGRLGPCDKRLLGGWARAKADGRYSSLGNGCVLGRQCRWRPRRERHAPRSIAV